MKNNFKIPPIIFKNLFLCCKSSPLYLDYEFANNKKLVVENDAMLSS